MSNQQRVIEIFDRNFNRLEYNLLESVRKHMPREHRRETITIRLKQAMEDFDRNIIDILDEERIEYP